MSDLLTHWGIFDDCRRLLPYADGIEPGFASAVEAELPRARLGAIVRTEGYWIPPLLRKARAERDAPELPIESRQALALCVAGLTHTACDRVMKEVMQRVTVEITNSADPIDDDIHRLVYAYQDVFVFRHVYADGAEAPFNRLMFAENTTMPGQALERIARTAFVGGLLGLRTMAPDAAHLDRNVVEPVARRALARVREGDKPARTTGSTGLSRRPFYDWLRAAAAGEPVDDNWPTIARLLTPDTDEPLVAFDNMLQGIQWLYVDLERLIEAYQRPNPALAARLGIDSVFYDANDPSIAHARAIQRGETVERAAVQAAFADSANRSAYGQALALGIAYLRQASAFWRGERDTLETPNYDSKAFRRWVAELHSRPAERKAAQ
jgi:hypothetical protein